MNALRIERDGPLWTLVLDRADKANALSEDLVEALLAALSDAERAAAAVVVLRGEGRNFSAGFDFGGYEDASEGDLLRRFVRIEQLLQALARSPCLTVGLAHGRNFGAGVDLFAACRWRVATAEATFRMPGLAFGVVLGTRRFAALVGPVRRARSSRAWRPSTQRARRRSASSPAWRRRTGGRRWSPKRSPRRRCWRPPQRAPCTARSTAAPTTPTSPTSCARSPRRVSRTASPPIWPRLRRRPADRAPDDTAPQVSARPT